MATASIQNKQKKLKRIQVIIQLHSSQSRFFFMLPLPSFFFTSFVHGFQWMAHSVLCEFLTKKHITIYSPSSLSFVSFISSFSVCVNCCLDSFSATRNCSWKKKSFFSSLENQCVSISLCVWEKHSIDTNWQIPSCSVQNQRKKNQLEYFKIKKKKK